MFYHHLVLLQTHTVVPQIPVHYTRRLVDFTQFQEIGSQSSRHQLCDVNKHHKSKCSEDKHSYNHLKRLFWMLVVWFKLSKILIISLFLIFIWGGGGVENLLIQSFYKSSPVNCSYSEKHQILPIRPKSSNILGDIECMEIWYISLHKEKYLFLIFCVKCHDLTLNLSDRLQLIHNWQHDNDMKFLIQNFGFEKNPVTDTCMYFRFYMKWSKWLEH